MAKYTWTPDKMFTPGIVESVAVKLFPDKFHAGDCFNYYGQEGEPCPVCAENNRKWAKCLADVRRALLDAFGHKNHP